MLDMLLLPPGFRGAAFTTAAAGDVRSGNRGEVADLLGITEAWSMPSRQVHGSTVIAVSSAGPAGEGDALATETTGLPIAVTTADCASVVLETDAAVAVAHAGWRGVVAGVVRAAARAVESLGSSPGPVRRAASGPSIGPCCFEVGADVAALFNHRHVKSIGGRTTVDLSGAVRDQVPDAEWWSAPVCTRCDEGYFSFRANRTTARMAAIGWLP